MGFFFVPFYHPPHKTICLITIWGITHIYTLANTNNNVKSHHRTSSPCSRKFFRLGKVWRRSGVESPCWYLNCRKKNTEEMYLLQTSSPVWMMSIRSLYGITWASCHQLVQQVNSLPHRCTHTHTQKVFHLQMFKLFSLLTAEPLTGDIYQLMVPLSFKLIFNKDGNM